MGAHPARILKTLAQVSLTTAAPHDAVFEPAMEHRRHQFGFHPHVHQTRLSADRYRLPLLQTGELPPVLRIHGADGVQVVIIIIHAVKKE